LSQKKKKKKKKDEWWFVSEAGFAELQGENTVKGTH
jgi:hypothetical protein